MWKPAGPVRLADIALLHAMANSPYEMVSVLLSLAGGTEKAPRTLF